MMIDLYLIFLYFQASVAQMKNTQAVHNTISSILEIQIYHVRNVKKTTWFYLSNCIYRLSLQVLTSNIVCRK